MGAQMGAGFPVALPERGQPLVESGHGRARPGAAVFVDARPFRDRRYPLGKWAAPEQPPLFRHIAGLDDIPPARWRWRQQAALLEFNSRTGAAAELAALLDQVNRARAVDLRGARYAGG
jgi:hypothetical protein